MVHQGPDPAAKPAVGKSWRPRGTSAHFPSLSGAGSRRVVSSGRLANVGEEMRRCQEPSRFLHCVRVLTRTWKCPISWRLRAALELRSHLVAGNCRSILSAWRTRVAEPSSSLEDVSASETPRRLCADGVAGLPRGRCTSATAQRAAVVVPLQPLTRVCPEHRGDLFPPTLRRALLWRGPEVALLSCGPGRLFP